MSRKRGKKDDAKAAALEYGYVEGNVLNANFPVIFQKRSSENLRKRHPLRDQRQLQRRHAADR